MLRAAQPLRPHPNPPDPPFPMVPSLLHHPLSPPCPPACRAAPVPCSHSPVPEGFGCPWSLQLLWVLQPSPYQGAPPPLPPHSAQAGQDSHFGGKAVRASAGVRHSTSPTSISIWEGKGSAGGRQPRARQAGSRSHKRSRGRVRPAARARAQQPQPGWQQVWAGGREAEPWGQRLGKPRTGWAMGAAPGPSPYSPRQEEPPASRCSPAPEGPPLCLPRRPWCALLLLALHGLGPVSGVYTEPGPCGAAPR